MKRRILLFVLFTVWGCSENCQVGENCARQCPDHAWGVCTETGMCRCQDLLDVLKEEKHLAMSECGFPEPGALVINEVLIDGEPSESEEFIEIVNTSAQSLRLDGVSIFTGSAQGMKRRITLELGCIAPHGVLLLGAGHPIPVLEPPWSFEPSYNVRRFGFSNSADFVAELRLFEMTVLDRVEIPRNMIRPGVSAVRSPEIQGNVFVDHRLESNGKTSSPGQCVDGRSITSRCGQSPSNCLQPEPGWLVLNEVMADAEPESREFVEIANATDKILSLSGLRVTTLRAEAESLKLEIWGGCLQPNELVAFYSADSQALARDRLLETLVFDAYRFRFSNDSDTVLLLRDANDTIVSRFEINAADIEEEVSVNRYPDIRGRSFSRHDRFFDGPSSPGLRAIPTARD